MSTFNPPADIAQITLAKSSDVNAIKAATAIAFGLLPDENKLQRGTVNFAVDTGTANTYVVALDASITTYTDGLQVVFRPLNSNSGTSTINLNGLGAKSIRLTDSNPISAGDISAGAVIDVRYSTATGFFHLTPNSAIYAADAGVSADAAAASAVASAGSASDALSYRNSAEGYKNTAVSSADAAAASAVASAGSASDALSYRNSAEGYKNTAVSSAAAASSSAVASAGSASDALSYRNSAEGYKNTAVSSAAAASSSATSAAAAYDSFDDRYLGAKASDPTLDNDGNALLTGALYWNSSANVMKVYNGGTWSVAYVSASSTGASIRPSLLLDFANSKTLDPRITFTRASTATYTGYDGLIKTATSGQARFDHNPTTGESLGLLIEEARTNLLTYSEQFDNAAWGKSNATITANATIAPDGTLTADKLVENTANSTHVILQAKTTTNTSPITASIYVKAAEKTSVVVQVQESTTFARYAWCAFNLSSGTAGTVTNTGGATSSSATIQSVGNGWYRCSVIVTLGGTDAGSQIAIFDGESLATYTGDGTSGLYIWGAQLEAGAFPTSYNPTVASQATRAADNAVMTGTNFSSWYRQDEGTCLAVFDYFSRDTSKNFGVFVISDGDNSDLISLFVGSGTYQILSIRSSDIGQAYLAQNPTLADKNTSVATYKFNDSALSLNGITPTVDTLVTIPQSVNRVEIAGFNGGTHGISQLNGHIAKLAYYPKRLTNAELQSITTV